MSIEDQHEKRDGMSSAEYDTYLEGINGLYYADTWSDDDDAFPAENNYVGWEYGDGWAYDDADDEEDDDYQVIDGDGDPVIFDPANYTFGVPPQFDAYLKWTPYSRAARRLLLLIARLDMALLRLRNRRRFNAVKLRDAIDELPF